MSRSKKKPWIKIGSTWSRRWGNKLFRAKTKQAIKEGKEPPVDKSEVMNDWDVVDYRYNYEHIEPDPDYLSEETRQRRIEESKRK